MTDLVRTVTVDDLAAMLQQKGFRAEPVEWPGGRAALRSATGGVSFNVVSGNGTNGAYHDFTYFASFRIDGLPVDEICGKWNAARRFGRVHSRDGFLNFEMDVMLGTGVSDGYLAVTLELWNQLLNELLAALREEAARTAPAA
ncbi:YbjN domain-containing protein [Aquabacter cavernae]|uniref:YbjN domain-containing protein n=1 Tax=Aquabacter cavernae TaxID=2496029 RepID=UPI000F8EAA23|nr:YbjN domain-containing protein [Aquabacter cavernae]